MKAKIKITIRFDVPNKRSKKMVFDNLDSVKTGCYRPVRERPADLPMMVEKYTNKEEELLIITNNFPESLQNAIEVMIKTYCNH